MREPTAASHILKKHHCLTGELKVTYWLLSNLSMSWCYTPCCYFLVSLRHLKNLGTVDHGEWEEMQRKYLWESRMGRNSNINKNNYKQIWIELLHLFQLCLFICCCLKMNYVLPVQPYFTKVFPVGKKTIQSGITSKKIFSSCWREVKVTLLWFIFNAG